MKEMIEFVVKHLVDDTGAVKVEETEAGGTFTYRIAVAPGEIGKIIGRQGRTVKAIRALAAAMDRKTGRQAVVEIEE